MRICPSCCRQFKPTHSTVKSCSRRCGQLARLPSSYPRGRERYNWNNGRSITTQGYVEVLCPNHFNPGRRGYKLEHRLVMEQFLNRPLLKREHVHHINGDKLDNRITNLKVINISDHQRHHHTFLIPRLCKWCLKPFQPISDKQKLCSKSCAARFTRSKRSRIHEWVDKLPKTATLGKTVFLKTPHTYYIGYKCPECLNVSWVHKATLKTRQSCLPCSYPR